MERVRIGSLLDAGGGFLYASLTSLTLTRQGRTALESYTAALRDLLGQL